MAERRTHPRSRVLKSAKLVLGNSSVFDCVVRNLTNAGACVEIQNIIVLPKRFHLSFDGGRSNRACKLVWRRLNGTAGLEFVK